MSGNVPDIVIVVSSEVIEVVIIEDWIPNLILVGSDVDGRVSQLLSVIHGKRFPSLIVAVVQANIELVGELGVVLRLDLSFEHFLFHH